MQLLYDLGRVPSPGRRIGTHFAASVRMVSGFPRLSACCGRTDLRLDDDRECRIDQPRARQRRETEDRRCRKTATGGDERGAGDLRAMQLGEAVDGSAEQLRNRV